ncbi:aminotransferase class V-fold PLP-dependent enzyme [Curvivirga sp.]|uniref:aminotransferase class V-fold PLP-dependent enzyme n=1 Tax=Curvivirga sp. TaxID=2856848 RepID=UPI003B5CE6A2
MLDIQRIRKETRGCENILHLNNAGSSLTSAPVQDYLNNYLNKDAELGGYETADLYKADLENFYLAAAKAVNGKPSEIAFIENATRAWDMVFYAFDWKPGDVLLTSVTDYNSNMVAYIHAKERFGMDFITIPNDEHGQLDVEAMEKAITPEVKLIAVSHIPTNSGLVNPVEKVGTLAKKHNIPFLLDACQSVGQMPIDVKKIGCDMLSTTGRKYIRGPRGTGFLWVSENWIEKLNPPFLDNYAAPWVTPSSYKILPNAKRFENWERYFGGQAALGVALDYMMDVGMENIWQRIQMLSSRLRDGLLNIEGVTLWDPGQQKCGLVTFTKEHVNASKAKLKLRENHIHISASGTQLTRPEQREAGITETIRASVHYYNTEEEIDHFINVMRNFTTD